MKQVDTLLVMLAEECAELQHAVAKILRFGLDGKYDDGAINRDQLQLEFNDVLAIAELLTTLEDVKIERDDTLIVEKLKKAKGYIT